MSTPSTPQLTAVPAPVDPLAGQNYRVRGLKVTLVIDVYDNEGLRVNVLETDPLNITEVEIDAALAELLARKTALRAGFVKLAALPTADAK